MLIPRTDTPGGADVGADKFLVFALAHGLDGTQGPDAGAAIQGANARYRRADGKLDHLAWLADELDQRANGDFLTAPLARQQTALDMIDRAAFANHQSTGPWPKIKGLLLTGYYTSEVGGSKELKLRTGARAVRPRPAAQAGDACLFERLDRGGVWMMADFDAIVVGSGITGGFAAKELTEAGLKVLMIERGPKIEHGSGYVTETLAPWDLPFRGLGDAEQYEHVYPVQMKNRHFTEFTQNHFVKDDENPYTTPEGGEFTWFRSYNMGGRSLTWGRQCYRWSDYDFGANKRDGVGTDWPIRYAELAPWYDRVEDFVGVSGAAEGLAQLPDGPLPAADGAECRRATRPRGHRQALA